MAKKQPRYQSERDFVKAFFANDDDWDYEPTVFILGKHPHSSKRKLASYKPDFYDRRRGVYIEVSRIQSAYTINKQKYADLRRMYPHIKFEVRNPDGTLFEENPIWGGPGSSKLAQVSALLAFNPFTEPTRQNRKLSNDQVLQIRSDPRVQREIAQDYGVSIALVSHIKTGRCRMVL